MGKECTRKPIQVKMWTAFCCLMYLTDLPLPVISSNENNHEYQPVIYADEVHIINDTVELVCTMHGDNNNLTFYRIKSGEQIDLVFEKLNATTIRHVTNAEQGIKEYFCEDTVSTKKAIKIIQGGIPPSKVEDFNCISYNFEILNCTWIGSDTGILMEYEVNLNTSKHMQVHAIKASNLDVTKRLYSCNWLLKGDAKHPYQNADINFSIGLTGSNALGKYEEFFPIDHISIVKLNPPTNLKSYNEGPHETTLSWKIDEHLKELLGNHLVMYMEVDLKSNIFERIENKTFASQNQETNDVLYTLQELPYAHLMYRVKISMKPLKASDKFWSDTAETIFNTTSEIPKSPDVPAGAYYDTIFENKRRITLYWKEHSKMEHGGCKFSYYINVLGNNYTKNYVTQLGFLQIDVPFEDVRISIFAENQKGRSRGSHLIIPHVNRKLKIYSLTAYNINNGSYYLSWSSYPHTFDQIEDSNNYTIMWCKKEINNECRDIDYTTVNGTERLHRIDVPKGNYQFAISANSNNNTSGLRWVDCEADSSVELNEELFTSTATEDIRKVSKMIICEELQMTNVLQWQLQINE